MMAERGGRFPFDLDSVLQACRPDSKVSSETEPTQDHCEYICKYLTFPDSTFPVDSGSYRQLLSPLLGRPKKQHVSLRELHA
jgi:hypothetical protein